MDNRTILIAAGVAAVGFGAVVLAKKAAANAGAIGQGAGAAVVNLADGVVSGVVTTAGEILGVPKTDMNQCQRDIAAGRTWDASFSCPAGTFLTYIMADKIDPPARTPSASGPSLPAVITPVWDSTPGIY